MKKIYCDNSATTPVFPEVIKEIDNYLSDGWGNASSVYTIGRESKFNMENARARVAKILNCEPEEIYFTSGGSESDNIFVKGCFKPSSAIITTSMEHPAIRNACDSLKEQDCLKITLSPNSQGLITLESLMELEGIIKKEQPIFATIMLVNNETGMIQPIKEISKYLKSICPNIIIHTDAVQAVGKVILDVKNLGVDSMSLSGHKFGAPKGIGILYLKKGIECKPLIDGGGQEMGLRSGTENIPYIMGIAKALELTYENFDKKIEELADFDYDFGFQILDKIPEARFNVPFNTSAPRAQGIFNIRFNGINAQNLLLFLDNAGIYVSAGSACHSDSDTPSHVLKAIGLTDEQALSSLRFSFKHPLSEEDINYIIETLKEGIKFQQKYDV